MCFCSQRTKSDLFQFSERVGPTKVLDGSRKALEYFEIVELVEKFEIIIHVMW
jgi:hypothetical protein